MTSQATVITPSLLSIGALAAACIAVMSVGPASTALAQDARRSPMSAASAGAAARDRVRRRELLDPSGRGALPVDPLQPPAPDAVVRRRSTGGEDRSRLRRRGVLGVSARRQGHDRQAPRGPDLQQRRADHSGRRGVLDRADVEQVRRLADFRHAAGDWRQGQGDRRQNGPDRF